MVTKMLIKVSLKCSRCYKKIKKILCKFPQKSDTRYTMRSRTWCVDHRRVLQPGEDPGQDHLQGRRDSVERQILPDKPKEPEMPKEREKPEEPEKPREPEKPKVVIVEPPKEPAKLPAPAPSLATASTPAPRSKAPEPAPPKPTQPALVPPPPEAPELVAGYLPVLLYPMVGVCCCPSYEGYGGGTCYYHRQRRPAMCYGGYGRPAYKCQGGNRGYYLSQCDYFSKENLTGCTVM